MKLGIGLVISGGYAAAIPTPFVQSLYALHSEILQRKVPGVTDLLRIDSGRFPVDCARNEIVRKALEADCDRLLFLDVDHVFTPAPILRLLASEADIITGRYHVRKPPYHPNLYVKPADTPRVTVDGDYKCIHYGRGVFPVDRCGAGALLVSRRALEDIGDPWFRYTIEPHEPFDMAVTEDFHFCEQAQSHGYTIWADWDAEIGHLTQAVVDGTFYAGYLAKMEQAIANGKPELAQDLVVCGYQDGYTLPSGQVIPPYGKAHAVA